MYKHKQDVHHLAVLQCIVTSSQIAALTKRYYFSLMYRDV